MYGETEVMLDPIYPGQTVVPWCLQDRTSVVLTRNTAKELRQKLEPKSMPSYVGVMMHNVDGRYVRTVCIYGELAADGAHRQAVWSEHFHSDLAFLPIGGLPPASYENAKVLIQLFHQDRAKGFAGTIYIKDDVTAEPLILVRKDREACSAAIGSCK